MIYQLFSTNGTLTACDAEPLAIGERVRYANDGRIYTITSFDAIGAIIINEEGKQHNGQRLDSISPFTKIQRVEGAEVASLEDVEALQALAIQRTAADRKAQDEAATRHAQDVQELTSNLRQQYPGMQPDQPGKNCKKLLQDAFPHVKFSVRYSSYSGGNSLDVSWKFGPTSKDVEEIAKQFQRGSFDGMTDCYEYDNSAISRAWAAVLGSVKYVSCQRKTGNLWEAIQEALRAKYTQNGNGSDWQHEQMLEREASATWQATTFPRDFKEGDPWEVVRNEDDSQSNYWTLAFPQPETPSTPEVEKVEAVGNVAGVTITENPSKDGVEVRFSSKPAAAILSKLKDAGFRWSKFQGLWYAKRTPRTLQVAREIGGIAQGAPDMAGGMIQAMEDCAADNWYHANYGMERY